MSAKLNINDKVLCRLYNTPDGKFYGDYFTAVITAIPTDKSTANARDYEVLRRDTGRRMTLHRKEIKRRIA